MRNLKKILALALALVMAMSLVTVANAAIDFDDVDEIEQKEAVDVMTAIGVIDGMDGTNYAPDGTLTREQAAKLIAYMLLGEKAENLGTTTTAVFDDVAATRWSAPYIAYCVSTGIINGNGDGTFNPTGVLTGFAFAKTLLCAIGYGVNDEYVGPNWAINVARDGVQIGLFKGCNVSDDPISRDDAARLAFNALRASLVSYSELFGTYTAYSQGFGEQDLLGTLAENVFDLKATFKTDGYGYTTRAWRQNNKVVTDYYNIDEIIDTITDADTTVGQLLRDYDWQTKDADGDPLKIALWVNGSQEDTDLLPDLEGAPSNTKPLKNGYIVNLVDSDENGEVDKVVVVVEYLAKVTRVNAATKSDNRSVNLEVYDTTGKRNVTNVETEDFEKDQYILIVPESNTGAGFQEPLEMKAAEVVTGSVTAYYKETVVDGSKNADGSVTVNGEKYDYNGIFAYTEKALGEELSTDGYTLGSKATYDFFLDSVGNVIGAKVVDDAISDYAYIIDKGEDAFMQENIAKVLLSDGTVATYTISDDSDDSAYDNEGDQSDCAKAGDIWAYSINSANEIVLTALTGDYSQKANSTTNTINSFTKGYSTISYKGSSATAYATDETVFIYYNNGKVAGMYVGKDNAPDIASTPTKYASVAVKTDSGFDYAQFVVITAEPAAVTGDNYVYALSSTYKGFSKDNNGDNAYYFEVIKDGEKVVIATDESSLKKGSVYNYGVDETAFGGDGANEVLAGLYDLTERTSSVEKGKKVSVVNSGVIVANDGSQYVVAPETVIADVDTGDSTTDIVFDATPNKDDEITVVYDTIGGLKVAKTIYITKTNND